MQQNGYINWLNTKSDLVLDLTKAETASVQRSIFVQYTGAPATLDSSDWAAQVADADGNFLALKSGMWIGLDATSNQIVPISNDDAVLAAAKEYTDLQIDLALQGRHHFGVVSSITSADATIAVNALAASLRPAGKSFAYEIDNGGTVDGVAYTYGGRFIGTVQGDGSIVWKGLIDDRVPLSNTLDTADSTKAITGAALATKMSELASVIAQSASNASSLATNQAKLTALDNYQKFAVHQTNYTNYADSPESSNVFVPSTSAIVDDNGILKVAFVGRGLADGNVTLRLITNEGASFKVTGNVASEEFSFVNSTGNFDFIKANNVSSATVQVAVQDAFDKTLYDLSTEVSAKIATAKAESATDAQSKADAAETASNTYTDGREVAINQHVAKTKFGTDWLAYQSYARGMVGASGTARIICDNIGTVADWVNDPTLVAQYVTGGLTDLATFIKDFDIISDADEVTNIVSFYTPISIISKTPSNLTDGTFAVALVEYNVSTNVLVSCKIIHGLGNYITSEDYAGLKTHQNPGVLTVVNDHLDYNVDDGNGGVYAYGTYTVKYLYFYPSVIIAKKQIDKVAYDNKIKAAFEAYKAVNSLTTRSAGATVNAQFVANAGVTLSQLLLASETNPATLLASDTLAALMTQFELTELAHVTLQGVIALNADAENAAEGHNVTVHLSFESGVLTELVPLYGVPSAAGVGSYTPVAIEAAVRETLPNLIDREVNFVRVFASNQMVSDFQDANITTLETSKEAIAPVIPFTVIDANYVQATGTITLPCVYTNILDIKVKEPVADGESYIPKAEILEIDTDGTNVILKVRPNQNWLDFRLEIKGN